MTPDRLWGLVLRGRRGPRPAGFGALPDLPTQHARVKEGLLALLDDLDRRLHFVRVFRHRVPRFYMLAPDGGQPRFNSPPGTVELAGPPGPPGTSGDLLLIRDAEGRLVLETAKARLGLPSLERSVVSGISTALANLNPIQLQGIQIHTNEFRDFLDRQLGRDHRLLALPGPPGPAGSLDALPAEARPPRLGPEEVAALLGRLEQDPDLKARIESLRRRIEER